MFIKMHWPSWLWAEFGRVGYGPSLLWAEFVMGRVCYGPRCPGIICAVSLPVRLITPMIGETNPGQVGLGSSRPESTRPGQLGLVKSESESQ